MVIQEMLSSAFAKLPHPAVASALGMAAAFYCYPFLGFPVVAAAMFFLIAGLCFFRVLRSLPVASSAVIKINVLSIALAAGFSLGIASRQTVTNPAAMGLAEEKITAVSGILREDPRALQSGSGLGVLELRESAGGGLRSKARGRIPVFFPPESIAHVKDFGRGAEIYSEGFYSDGNRGPVFNAHSVHIVKPAPPIEAFRTRLRTSMLDRFQSRSVGNAHIWGGLASAMVLGMRDDIDSELYLAFKNSGSGYILALSGMHLAIISGVLAFLLKRPLGIRMASLVGAVFIVAYVFVAGSQPSLVRAALMYLLGTFAIWTSQKGNAISLLSMAFILQMSFQSETGLSPSFIFSYLALLGILTLGKSLDSVFRGRIPGAISGSLSVSIGAFLFTAPIAAYFLGEVRPIGILAGIFAVPLCSLFMLFAIAALAASFLPFPLWHIFDFALAIIYRLMEFTLNFAGLVPGISISDPIPVLAVSLFVCLAAFFISAKDKKQRSVLASFG